ncbi:hypothetical protein C0991_004354, partial [Blastosporella zonata]
MVDNSLDMDVPTLFASNLRTFSNNTITDLQYAGLTRDEALSCEALQVAAGLFEMWDQRPKKLQDEDWTEQTAVMEAGQELWMMWSLKEWAQEMPYYKFFSVSMGSGPSNARPTKISKTRSGQPSTKQAKVPVDISGAHATDKDLVDEGLEGDIAVRVRWSTRALVQLAPHSERLEFWEAEGPCQQCTTAKVAERCWYPQNSVGDMARDAQRRVRVVRKRAKRTAALATRAVRALDNDKEAPTVGPSHMTPALPTLGVEDNEGEVLGVGILGGPKLEEERDDGAPVAPEGVEGDRGSESAKSVWRPTDAPVMEFERVTR